MPKQTYSHWDVLLASPTAPMPEARRLHQLTLEKLKETLSYDAETGVFTWTDSRVNSRRPGSNIAGALSLGYVAIQIKGRLFRAHRLAWLYMTGSFPRLEIDHINGNPSDNRFINLREVDSRTNKENRHRARSDNKSGLLGAHFHKRFGWRSSIKVNGKTSHLGYFKTALQAHEAYVKAKREMHHGCTI